MRDGRLGRVGIGVQVHAEDPHVLDHDVGHQLALLAGLVVHPDIAGEQHVDMVAGQDVAAAACDVGHPDGVGPHAGADLGRQRRASAGAAELLRQQGLTRGDGGQGHRRAARVGLQHLGGTAVGVERDGAARQLHHHQVFRLELGPVGNRPCGQHHRHALHRGGRDGGRLALRTWQPCPGDQ